MATIRRLSDDDVKAVFDCVHNNRAPPPNLPFQIVNVGPNGLKLSPPSFEFEDGLYILLRPIKKKGKKEIAAAKKEDPRNHPSIPSNLMRQVMLETPAAACPWSLSGPQFPQPTAIQQRYCYPKGNPSYSSRKGGALWTMYELNGKEDLEYRLLHVYFSAKRAVNKGVEVPKGMESTPKRYSSPKKKQRRSKKKTRLHRDDMPSLGSPAADSAESSVGSSPLSFQVPPPSPSKDPALTETHGYMTTKFITPEKEGFSDNFHPVQFTDDAGRNVSVSMASPLPHNIRPKHSTPYQYAVGYSPGVHKRGSVSNNTRAYPSQELRTPSQPRYPYQQQYQMPQSQYDLFPLEGGANVFDMDSSSWPFTSPAAAHGFPTPEGRDAYDSSTQDNIKSFAANLDTIHDSIRETIGKADDHEQGHLVNVLCGWAKKLMQMPLGSTDSDGGGGEIATPANPDIRQQHSFSASPSYPRAHHAQYNEHQQQYYSPMSGDLPAEADKEAAV